MSTFIEGVRPYVENLQSYMPTILTWANPVYRTGVCYKNMLSETESLEFDRLNNSEYASLLSAYHLNGAATFLGSCGVPGVEEYAQKHFDAALKEAKAASRPSVIVRVARFLCGR